MLSEASFIGFIPVADIATAQVFYRDTLGLTVVDESPFALVVDACGTMLRITPVEGLSVQPFTIAGWNVPDLPTTVRDLAVRNVTFVRYGGMDQDEDGIWTAPNGDRVAWFRDPDGNTLSLTAFAHGS